MARHYINFRNNNCLYFDEFRQEWEKSYPHIHIIICSAEYKKATRLIFKCENKRLTYYLKDRTAELLTPHDCVLCLKDMLDREWNYDEYCNRC